MTPSNILTYEIKMKKDMKRYKENTSLHFLLSITSDTLTLSSSLIGILTWLKVKERSEVRGQKCWVLTSYWNVDSSLGLTLLDMKPYEDY